MTAYYLKKGLGNLYVQFLELLEFIKIKVSSLMVSFLIKNYAFVLKKHFKKFFLNLKLRISKIKLLTS